jgi:Transposase family tnp2
MHWQFLTIPIGPIIQALYHSLETAEKMHYQENTTEAILKHAKQNGGWLKEYNDMTCSREYLDACCVGKIKNGDVMIQISLNGAQLYADKDSDCWIFICVIHNLPPDLQYKKHFVIPAGFIGGLKKPKHTDSYLYPALSYISALQKEGLKIWDAWAHSYIPKSIPFLMLVAADGPAMTDACGNIGHSGKCGCQLFCALSG